ncbi:MAG: gliding motility lipoprotein GldH [Bacteroidales bacterium]
MKNNNKLLLISMLVVFCICFNSCRKNVYFSSATVFDREQWKATEIATFTIDVKDCTQPYDINLLIRNSGRYSFANLWIFLTTVDPDNNISKEKFNCKLAREDGKWLGRRSAGHFDNTIPYKTNYKFNKPGKYTLSLEQGMRIDPLPGISVVGIQVIFTEQ